MTIDEKIFEESEGEGITVEHGHEHESSPDNARILAVSGHIACGGKYF